MANGPASIKVFFCWLSHLKMSLYYPTSHKGQWGSILLVHYSMASIKVIAGVTLKLNAFQK